MRMGEVSHLDVEVIPTGSLALDRALGVGGVPRGRVTEIYGPDGAGKTTLAQHIVAEAQKRGGTAAYIDMEHALDPAYARNLGVNVDELLISQPDTGEQALEIAETLIRSGAVDVIVVDSVAALVPRAEIEGEMGDSHPGLQARLMSQALRKLSGAIKQSNAALIFTNQLREKIGVMFGNPETTSGGRALKFYASVRLDIRRVTSIKDRGELIGTRTRVRVTKNKVAPPFKKAEMEILFGKGISSSASLLDAAVKYDLIQKSGSWYSYGNDRIGQGRENVKQFLEENTDVANEIEQKLRPIMFPERYNQEQQGGEQSGSEGKSSGSSGSSGGSGKGKSSAKSSSTGSGSSGSKGGSSGKQGSSGKGSGSKQSGSGGSGSQDDETSATVDTDEELF